MNNFKNFWNKLFSDTIATPPALATPRYLALDGLRGVAILIVVTVHFGINHFLWRHNLQATSDIGVNIFFILSGFLITTLLLKEKHQTGTINLKHFYARRALRLLPMACIFLAMLAVLKLLFQLKTTSFDILTALFFIKNLPVRNDPYTAHFWTLAVEVQFYLIFPVLLASGIKRYVITVLAIIIVTPAIAIAGYYQTGFLYSNNTLALITKIMMYAFWKGPLIILIGSFFSVLVFKGVIDIGKIKSSYFMGFVLMLIAIVISTPKFIFYTKYVSEYVSCHFNVLCYFTKLW
jgi:peptidoglycan/LPS O-acetylase OafA/YrhL